MISKSPETKIQTRHVGDYLKHQIVVYPCQLDFFGFEIGFLRIVRFASMNFFSCLGATRIGVCWYFFYESRWILRIFRRRTRTNQWLKGVCWTSMKRRDVYFLGPEKNDAQLFRGKSVVRSLSWNQQKWNPSLFDSKFRLERKRKLRRDFFYRKSLEAQGASFKRHTPPKTNMEPENEGLEDHFPFQMGDL